MHDGSLDELHHRVTAVLKLWVTPQAERPCRTRNRETGTQAHRRGVALHRCVCVTSVVLHACVVCDSLRPEAQTQDVARVWAVPHQKRAVRFPLQLHLSVLPVHRPPVPAALKADAQVSSAHSHSRLHKQAIVAPPSPAPWGWWRSCRHRVDWAGSEGRAGGAGAARRAAGGRVEVNLAGRCLKEMGGAWVYINKYSYRTKIKTKIRT